MALLQNAQGLGKLLVRAGPLLSRGFLAYLWQSFIRWSHSKSACPPGRATHMRSGLQGRLQ